jgi:pullulanase
MRWLMKKLLTLIGLISQLFSAKAQLPAFESYPVYNGNDLGLTYYPSHSIFRIWAPVAEQAEIIFYKEGTGGQALSTHSLTKSGAGTWLIRINGDKKGLFYAFRVLHNNTWSDEVPDPYAKAVGVNGKRAMVVNLKDTDPVGWARDKSSWSGSARKRHPTEAVLYELHIRDASIAQNGHILQKGKFLGLTETGTKNDDGLSTGLDHLVEMGVTHIHLLPSYDFNSIDETKPDSRYNWGYDPLNYNVPEGSYSTDPYDGITRIREFKQMIHAMHQKGLNVVMDVVYNHTALTERSNFNQLVPGYYYRQTANGKFSNATACGNETASERPMMRKFILESMKYWVQEYHIDGFRIDLMGVHDIETMNLVSKELHKIKPNIVLYGEGWTAGSSPLPDSLRAIKANAHRLDRIAVFSDDIRDGIKGSVFDHPDKGFASGKPGMDQSIWFGVVASCPHPQVDYSKVNYSKKPYALVPANTISYAECHDNHVLWDKLAISASAYSEAERTEMHKLALSIVFTSQGISFLHAGGEFLRSKKGVENSFESPDSINAIDWNLKTKNKEIVEYVKALITLKRQHPAFRMQTAKDIAGNIVFVEGLPPGLVVFRINAKAVGDSWKKIYVLYNGTGILQSFNIGPKEHKTYIRNNRVEKGLADSKTTQMQYINPFSCSVFYEE